MFGGPELNPAPARASILIIHIRPGQLSSRLLCERYRVSVSANLPEKEVARNAPNQGGSQFVFSEMNCKIKTLAIKTEKILFVYISVYGSAALTTKAIDHFEYQCGERRNHGAMSTMICTFLL